ncbi:DoxX family protein [Methylosinus sporium]|uniref:DoxX family protein n=1 Tax=Methylosinus sporium TaxID=428 RepID=UPI002795DFDF|nr:DoxX family protein [Methylosinus sporium]
MRISFIGYTFQYKLSAALKIVPRAKPKNQSTVASVYWREGKSVTEANVYWIATALLSLLYLTSALLYLSKGRQIRQLIGALGYPGYLVQVLIIVKLLAVAAILLPMSVALSNLAYAGMFYHLLLAILAHLGVRDVKAALPAAFGLALLAGSFLTQNAARELSSPYGAISVETKGLAR